MKRVKVNETPPVIPSAAAPNDPLIDERFMAEAITLSALAVRHGNEPFGAVLVKNGEILFTNENQIYTRHDPTFHAEIGLLRRFFAQTEQADLRGCTLYSSCEPCFMCSGALVWAQLGRLVYAASNRDLAALVGDEGCDCCRTVFSHSIPRPAVTGGVLRGASLAILSEYFSSHSKG